MFMFKSPLIEEMCHNILLLRIKCPKTTVTMYFERYLLLFSSAACIRTSLDGRMVLETRPEE